MSTSLAPKPMTVVFGLGTRLRVRIWHSKTDKIVNNFHGQNRFQFHGQIHMKYLFFMVKTLIFVVKTDFLMFRPTNFLVRSQNILVTKFLGHKISWSISIPFQFYAQLHSIPTAFHGQSRFHGQDISVSIYLHPMSATPSCLTSVSFECSLGTVTILYQRCRI